MTHRTTSWNTPYTFSGKEKDVETGYSYFGARYYDSQLSVWISVDPLSDKYPSMSPYTYCANNPIMMVDPDGKRFLIFGIKAQEFINQLNHYTNLDLLIEGNTVRARNTNPSSKLDRIILKVIESDQIDVQIICGQFPNGGSYLGNIYIAGDNNSKEKVIASQGIEPDVLAANDTKVGDSYTGGYAIHEFLEAFYGAKIALWKNKGSKAAIKDENGKYPKGCTYLSAHRKANRIMEGGIYYDNGDRLDYNNPIITTDWNGNTKTTIPVIHNTPSYSRTK